ncbi:hypothetical protein NPIL_622881 [Nephila pilipes]|uniref:Uncharacterized protein n=1 Tax=Nephila pilipes TaxID=299642 RepID=A0A8X6T7L4_NEPPI|nr:hypothetical protein NPIL_622881 [Nephila pilipes]
MKLPFNTKYIISDQPVYEDARNNISHIVYNNQKSITTNNDTDSDRASRAWITEDSAGSREHLILITNNEWFDIIRDAINFYPEQKIRSSTVNRLVSQAIRSHNLISVCIATFFCRMRGYSAAKAEISSLIDTPV